MNRMQYEISDGFTCSVAMMREHYESHIASLNATYSNLIDKCMQFLSRRFSFLASVTVFGRGAGRTWRRRRI